MTLKTTEQILGYTIYEKRKEDCFKSILEWIERGNRCRYLACINPHSYITAIKNQYFANALQRADWLVPDGAGIVLASRFLNKNIRERITGNDIFVGVNTELNSMGKGSVFFLGSTEETLDLIYKKMVRDYPNVRVAGTYSPPYKSFFSEEDTDKMIQTINSVTPDVLWIGMTSPKQDVWIYQNRHRLNVKFAAGIGAVFDFYTGRVKRSHPVFQKLGLEWLPRLLREPRRLWKRTFISAPVFMWHILREVVFKTLDRQSNNRIA